MSLTAVEGTVYFDANDGIHGREPWRSDGTEVGTVMIADLTPGSGDSFPHDFAAAGGMLFFRSGDFASYTGQLWKSDGTAAGTIPVAPNGISTLGGLVDLGGTLMLAQDDGEHGYELWRSDGTTAGTVLVKDINPGPASSFPYPLTVVNGVLLFTADDGRHGTELWRSDGTADGTQLVTDINPGPAPLAPFWSAVTFALDDVLLLAADDGVHGSELWRSDGTERGTVLVKDLLPGPVTADASPSSLTALGDTLVFVADDGRTGPVLWKTDGTETGTASVADLKDINEGTPQGSNRALTQLDGQLFFGADDRVTGNELWKSDGTAAGTALVKDIRPGPDSALPGEVTRVGDTLFFAADDGTHGRELWKSDGTAAGTILVKDIEPGLGASSPTQLIDVDGRLFFTIGPDWGSELWTSDGTAAGTISLVRLFGTQYLTNVAGTLYFTSGTTLWKSDGTAAGTVAVADFHPVSGEYVPNDLTAAGGRLFFVAKEPDGSDVKLWSIDGEHLVQLRGVDAFQPSNLTSAADRLFFIASDAEHGDELWTSDGSVVGTRLVRDINPGPAGSSPSLLSPAAGRLLFTAFDGDAWRVWESDGTEAGTRPIAALGSLSPSAPFVAAGALAFFPASDFASGSELRAAPLPADLSCGGDCDGDGRVTIGELVHLVRIALGEADAASCPTVASPQVGIDDLVSAVNHSLTGCDH